MKVAIPFGRYLLLDRINVGGMAEVFLAKFFGAEGFARLLAIKRILPNMADDDEFINMFVDEARIAVQLSHANIVQISELGKYENQYYIAMEYVPGKDLRQILDVYRKKKETLPIPAAAFIASKICEGLDYAHRKTDPTGKPLNLIHRDVSPQNILVSFEGAAKVTDFGIAKAEDRASKTQAGVLKGKFGYMSPEQVRGLDIDQRSDVFAVGILLYEMVTGKRLFIGESDFSTLEKVRNAEVIPPTQHNPSIPEALEKVMLKALAREQADRYTWASDLADDLQQFLIEDNTIFNAKKLAALLKANFAEDIEKERARIEEAMRVEPPEDFNAQAPPEAEVPHGSDARAEKTMIFESVPAAAGEGFGAGAGAGREEGGGADLSNLPTQIAPETSRSKPSSSPGQKLPATGRMQVGTSASKAGAPRRTGNTGVYSKSQVTRLAPNDQTPKSKGIYLIAGAILLTTVVLLLVLVLWPNPVGTLVITSSPIDKIDVFVDGTKIGDHTPISRADIQTGVHTLLARAQGYLDKAYRFELVAGAPAVINVEMDRNPAVGAQIRIESEPDAATVRVGGISQGVTPLTLPYADVGRPFIYEISKEGCATEQRSVVLAGEAKKTDLVKLKCPPDSAGSVALGAPTPGKIIVRSTPTGATVIINGQTLPQGTDVAVDVPDTAKTYDVVLKKDGYRDANIKTIFEAGKTEVELRVPLMKPDKPRPVGGGTPKPAGGGGGKSNCSGSGAKISVMALGASDCNISVGPVKLGFAPAINKDAPVGNCDVKVTCADGKKYSEKKELKAGGPAEKVIIKPDMWH
jgi:serine/threonine protein kinase